MLVLHRYTGPRSYGENKPGRVSERDRYTRGSSCKEENCFGQTHL